MPCVHGRGTRALRGLTVLRPATQARCGRAGTGRGPRMARRIKRSSGLGADEHHHRAPLVVRLASPLGRSDDDLICVGVYDEVRVVGHQDDLTKAPSLP